MLPRFYEQIPTYVILNVRGILPEQCDQWSITLVMNSMSWNM